MASIPKKIENNPQSSRIVGAIWFGIVVLCCRVNQLFTDLINIQKSSYCSVEFQSNVGAISVVKGFSDREIREVVSAASGSAARSSESDRTVEA